MRFLVYILVLFGCTTVCAQGDSAAYEDEIEKRRKELFAPGGQFNSDYVAEPAESPKVSNSNPFDRWKRNKQSPPDFRFYADAVGGRRNLDYLSNKGDSESYGTLDDLQEKFLSYPPPPAPKPKIKTDIVWNPGTDTTPFYDDILAFIQAGPGPGGVGTVGTLISVQDLQYVTPYLLAVVPLAQAGMSLQDILNTPEGQAAWYAVQSVLQPIGMWDVATLNAWIDYIDINIYYVEQVLLKLYDDLISAQPPGTDTVVTVIVKKAVNPFEVLTKIRELLEDGDENEIAEKLPSLVHAVTKHLGFNKPMIVLYGSRSGNDTSVFPYKLSILTERRRGDRREVHVLNEEGYYINEYPSGVGRFWQGPDDLSLVYLPVVVNDGRVHTMDVVASDLYAWLKRASGGNVRLLDRAATHNTALIFADLGFFDGNKGHIRVVGGSTPHSSLGGVMGELEFGDEDDIFSGHVGGGVVYQDTYFKNAGNEIGYLDVEATLRTPYLDVIGKENDRGFRTWASLTLAGAGMVHRPTGSVIRRGEEADGTWGLQGEVRVIPELHGQLTIDDKVLLTLYGGVTSAIVPGGNINLEHPERTLSLYPIRSHVGGNIKAMVHPMVMLELDGVTEVSDLVRKTRVVASAYAFKGSISFVSEFEHYTYDAVRDVRVGGGVSWRGMFVNYLHSLYDADYRLEAGVDIGQFWD